MNQRGTWSGCNRILEDVLRYGGNMKSYKIIPTEDLENTYYYTKHYTWVFTET